MTKRSSDRCPIAVFAKAPVPGTVKTRLIATLGASRAAELHRALVLQALEAAVGAGTVPVELHCAPGTGDAFFAQCARRFGVGLVDQSAGDLGSRMLRAFSGLLERHDRALLIGSDVPCMSPDYLRGAAAMLDRGYDAVVGPAEDGGYVLIGLRKLAPELFETMPWGTGRVFAMTCARLRSLDWRWAQTAAPWDLDRPEDLSHPGLPARLARIAAGAAED